MHSSITPDGGPLYTETNFDHFIREPFNATTAVLYLFLAIYWIIQIQKNKNLQSRFLMFALPVLAIGGIGGTLFHA
jgi:hemolysin III